MTPQGPQGLPLCVLTIGCDREPKYYAAFSGPWWTQIGQEAWDRGRWLVVLLVLQSMSSFVLSRCYHPELFRASVAPLLAALLPSLLCPAAAALLFIPLPSALQ